MKMSIPSLKTWSGSRSFMAGVATTSLAFTVAPSLSVQPLLDVVKVPSAPARPAVPPSHSLPVPSDLQTIAQSPRPDLELVGATAEAKNENLPFSPAASPAAKPFVSADLSTDSGKTALQCLTQAIYYEAGFEPMEGRRAVAQVVLNRLRHSAFPKSVCGVVYQGSTKPGCQFSFTCDGSLARKPEPAAWEQARQVAVAALGGYVEQSVGHATHYHANYVYPYWAPRLVKLTRLGAHIFYRWPGTWGTPAAFAGKYAGFETIPAWRKVSDAPQLAEAGAAVDGEVPTNTAAGAATRSPVGEAGGRIDVSTGWRMHISDPHELNRASSAAVRRQNGVNALLEEAAGAKYEPS